MIYFSDFSASTTDNLADLFTGGAVGDWWRFDNVYTDQTVVGSNISTATGVVNGYVMTPPDALNRPNLQQPSGLYCARFDGAADRMVYTFGSTLTQPGTLILCVNQNAAGSTKVLATGSSTTSRWQASIDGSSNLVGFAGATLDSTLNANFGFKVLTYIWNGASSIIRANGVQVASGNMGTQSTNQITVGALWDGTFGVNMDLYSVLIRSGTALTTGAGGELDRAERLLGSHAGISW